MEGFLRDIKHGGRSLLRNPGFTSAAVVALALGIGATSAIFSVLDGVVLHPLPYPGSERLYRLNEVTPRGSLAPWAPGNFVQLQHDTKAFEGVAAVNLDSVNLVSRAEPEKINVARVTASLFPVLGITPALGRTLRPEEDRASASPAVVISDSLWRRRFDANPEVVGRSVLLDGRDYTIVGVLRPGVQLPERRGECEAYLNIAFDERDLQNRGMHMLRVVGRLASGVTPAQGQAELDVIAQRNAAASPFAQGWRQTLLPLQEDLIGNSRPAIQALLAAVLLVLLIACVNVASMLLARGASRQRELAIRAALGGERLRLVRQLLTESLVLGLAGGLLGLLLATWAVDGLVVLGPRDLPRLHEVALNGRVVAFAIAISLLTGALSGIIPALQGSRADVLEALKSGGRSATGKGRTREILVVAELALALVLVIGAGLLVRSFWQLTSIDPGFEARGVLTADMQLPDGKYAKKELQETFYTRLLTRVRALPGVRYASATSALPLSPRMSLLSFQIAGRPPKPPADQDTARLTAVMPGYFATMGIAVLQGRPLDERDHFRAPKSVVVNEEFARRFFPGEEAVGHRLDQIVSQDDSWEIVGVVRNTREGSLEKPPDAHLYLPALQSMVPFLNLVVKTDGDPMALVPAIRAEVLAIDPQQPLSGLRTMEQLVSGTVGQRRFQMLLVVLFAAVALVLAALGIYGVTAYSVAQRTREIGIRIALGADRRSVLRLVLGRVLRLSGAGIFVGLGAALLATRLIAAFLYGIAPTDPLTYGAIALLLGLTALAAGYVPARKALSVDPMVALRAE